MSSMLCDVWQDFSNWVVGWGDIAFWVVVSIFAVIGLCAMVNFVKKSYNYAKDERIKWGVLIFAIVMSAIVTVVCIAKFA